MLNRITLQYDDPELQSKYLDNYRQMFSKKFGMFLLVSDLFLLIQVFSSKERGDYYEFTLCLCCMVINFVMYFAFLRGFKNTSAIVLITSVLIFLALYRTDNWLTSFSYGLFQMMLFQHGTNLWISFIQWLFCIITLLLYFPSDITLQLQGALLLLSGILYRYDLERTRREDFLSHIQNQKWVTLIEQTLPSWVVVLRYDNKFMQITIDKINNHLKREMKITDEKKLREILRKMIVVESHFVGVNYFPNHNYKRIDIEAELIAILTQDQTDDQETKEYYGYLQNENRLNNISIYKITVVNFYQLQPQILLLFEEISLAHQEEQKNAKTWRETFLEALTQKTLTHAGSCIAFLKTFQKEVSKSKLNNKVIQEELKHQIQKQYFNFNTNLNTLCMSLIESKTICFRIDKIRISQLLESLKSDVLLNTNYSHRISLIRQVPTMGQDVIQNDRQKITQIIISLVDFIHHLNEISQTPKLPIEISITRDDKNYQGCYAVRLFHPFLNVPFNVQQALNTNWAKSSHNQARWGMVQHFSEIQKLTEAMQESLVQQTDEQLNRLILSGVPIAMYLISQLGPSNEIFFKKKNQTSLNHLEDYTKPQRLTISNDRSYALRKSQNSLNLTIQNISPKLDFTALLTSPRVINSTQRRRVSIDKSSEGANYLKFFIYEDLKVVVDEINRVNQEPIVLEKEDVFENLCQKFDSARF